MSCTKLYVVQTMSCLTFSNLRSILKMKNLNSLAMYMQDYAKLAKQCPQQFFPKSIAHRRSEYCLHYEEVQNYHNGLKCEVWECQTKHDLVYATPYLVHGIICTIHKICTMNKICIWALKIISQMAMNMIWNWQLSHTNCMFCNWWEVGVQLKVTIYSYLPYIYFIIEYVSR